MSDTQDMAAQIAADIDPMSEGVIFIVMPTLMSNETAFEMRNSLREKMPNREFAILPPGAKVIDSATPSRLEQELRQLRGDVHELAEVVSEIASASRDTIAALQTLLTELAADPDPEGDEPGIDLDGQVGGKPREAGTSLDG